METLYFTESGLKRKGAIYSCELCKNEFISRLNSDRKYCSQKCSAEAQKNQIQAICEFCKKSFHCKPSRKNASKSGLLFCSRECKETAQNVIHRILKIEHYGDGKYRYSKRAKKYYCEFCEICNYDEYKQILEVHHIDFSRDNNDINNLIVLCPNHHSMITRGVAELIDRKLVIKGH